MKYLIIIFFSVFSFKISTANEIRKLPKIFFLDCEQNVIGRHLILIDQVNNKVEIKSPNFKVFNKITNNENEIIFSDFNYKYTFNKWTGIFFRKPSISSGYIRNFHSCKILSKNLKPLYK